MTESHRTEFKRQLNDTLEKGVVAFLNAKNLQRPTKLPARVRNFCCFAKSKVCARNDGFYGS